VTIESSLAAAKKAHIPVACLMCENTGYEDEIIDVSTGGAPGGAAIAWDVIAESKGKAKVLLVDDKAYSIVKTRVDGFRATLEQNCPDCKIVDTMQISPASLAKPGPPEWLGALQRYPEGTFDWAVFPYDYYALPAGKTAIEQGRDVAITGYDGVPEMVRMIEKDGPIFRATVAAPFEYLPWVAMDQVARASAGLKTWDTKDLPLRLVTPANAAEFPKGWFAPADFDPKEAFTPVWSGK
jgi:ribose transport system substrate-binding protein